MLVAVRLSISESTHLSLMIALTLAAEGYGQGRSHDQGHSLESSEPPRQQHAAQELDHQQSPRQLERLGTPQKGQQQRQRGQRPFELFLLAQ